MSSSNKTTNLGLNQWVLTDPFLMEDMNADNQKIDAAVGSMPYKRLLSITTASDAQRARALTASLPTNRAYLDQLRAPSGHKATA